MVRRPSGVTPAPLVDVVIPVLDEAHVLAESVSRVRAWLHARFPYRWRLVIVDNGSADATARVAASLASSHPDVVFLQLEKRGRGRALRHAWLTSPADAVCYMDVDLSTRLDFLTPLLQAVLENGAAVATGSRLLPASRTTRSWPRELISRAYNLITRLVLGLPVSDAQCGFKAVSRQAVNQLVPLIADESWFFDTELLFLAHRCALKIAEIPVVWIEDDDSRVKIVRTALDDLRGIWRLRRSTLPHPFPARGTEPLP